ncbi:amidase, partial [Stella sp.]|uniref:amidase n=1 Tax=Stella sp. TaxID=2912054 RepID=UPI0035AE9244
MQDIPFRSAKELASLVRRKKVSALELLDLYLTRVEQHNPALNAIVAMDVERARKRAKAADRALAKGKSWGPLHGVPMTIKESYDVAGMPTTWGLPAYADNIAPKNAVAVDRLEAAGVVLFGKTNVPAWLADWQSYNAVYGTCNNPWDLSKTPGGSSGGSAAALAAGLTGIEAGSDIGASIRNPAHYCGVYGHKPTMDICPGRGQALPGKLAGSDIAVVGPMARSADDLDIALTAMAGPDEIEAGAWQLRLPPCRKKTLKEFRVAVVLDDPNGEVDREIQDRLQELADFLARKMKVKVADAHPDIDTTDAHRTYIHLLRMATCGRQSDEEFARNAEIAKALAADDDSYYARMMRANTGSHRDWLAWNEKRRHLQWAWQEFFRSYDILLCPAASTTAFAHNHEGNRWDQKIIVNGKPVSVIDQMFWAGYPGVVYLPATVAPAGLSPSGLPIGVQIVGPFGGDRSTIAFARLLAKEWHGYEPPPGY